MGNYLLSMYIIPPMNGPPIMTAKNIEAPIYFKPLINVFFIILPPHF